MELLTLKREGIRLIKYKSNVADTKHLILLKHRNKYYAFTMFRGELVGEIEERTTLPKRYKDYRDSSLNEWRECNRV